MRRTTTLFVIAVTLIAAGLAPEAVAEPTAITTCQTLGQPGSYVLKQNLTATGNCLVIMADFVTIDLAGFSITGSGSGNAIMNFVGTGPQRGFPGMAVRNGTISNFSQAVFAFSVPEDEGAIVEGLRISGVGGGIGARGIVKGNTVNCGAGSGVGISDFGTVAGNRVINCGGDGINAVGVVSGNTVESNGTGIFIQGLAIGNSAIGNGVGISATCPSNVTDNVAINNGKNLVLSGAGCKTKNNVAP
jgi:hypothetical protein